MTTVAPSPNGGLDTNTRQRILSKLPSRLDVIARLLIISSSEVDVYFSQIRGYVPQTESVKNYELTLLRRRHYQITISLHKNLSALADLLGESELITKQFLENCFVKATGAAFQTVASSSQRPTEHATAMTARA